MTDLSETSIEELITDHGFERRCDQCELADWDGMELELVKFYNGSNFKKEGLRLVCLNCHHVLTQLNKSNECPKFLQRCVDKYESEGRSVKDFSKRYGIPLKQVVEWLYMNDPTYNETTKTKNRCKDCNTKITKRGKRCRRCASKIKKEKLKKKDNEKELQIVWKMRKQGKPVRVISKKVGVSVQTIYNWMKNNPHIDWSKE